MKWSKPDKATPLPPCGAPTDVAPQPPSASNNGSTTSPATILGTTVPVPPPPPLTETNKDALIASLTSDLEHHRRALKALEVEMLMKNELLAKVNGNFQQVLLRQKMQDEPEVGMCGYTAAAAAAAKTTTSSNSRR
jgi:hypothetical protein